MTARTSRIKLSCNLYSFNAALTSGEMSLEQVIDFCAGLGFAAVDPTGYYFKGYPAPAADEEIYRVKHRAFRSGLDITRHRGAEQFRPSRPRRARGGGRARDEVD